MVVHSPYLWIMRTDQVRIFYLPIFNLKASPISPIKQLSFPILAK